MLLELSNRKKFLVSKLLLTRLTWQLDYLQAGALETLVAFCCISKSPFNAIRPKTPVKRPVPLTELPPKPKRIRTKSKTRKKLPAIDRKTLAALGSAADISARKSSLQINELKRRASNRESKVTSSVGGRTLERDISEYSHIFDTHFATKDCPFSFTKKMIYCCDLVDFIYLLCWLRGHTAKELRHIKINGDDGQGSFKLMLGLLFEGDRILGDDELDLSDFPDGNGGLLDNGVNRTYIISIMYGAKENLESSQFLFNSVDIQALSEEFPCVDLSLTQDMKFSNSICGIGTHSSRFSLVYSLFSPNPAFSRPNVKRTIGMLVSDNAARKTANGDPKEFNSVVTEHCPFLAGQSSRDLLDLIPPPPLHMLLGIVAMLFTFLSILCLLLADDFPSLGPRQT